MLINLGYNSVPLQDAIDGASPGDRIVLRDTGNESATVTVDRLILEGSPYAHGTMALADGVRQAAFLTHSFLYQGTAPPFDYTDGITFDIFANDDGVDVTLSGLNATFHGGSGDDLFRFETPPSYLLYNAGGLSAAAHGGAGDDTLFVNDSPLNQPMSNSIGADGTSGEIIGGDQRSRNLIDQTVTYDGFEHLHLIGGSAGDTLTGTANSDTLSGSAGADMLDGNSGADRLLGGAGDDELTGGAGRDYLAGGAGGDIFFFDAGDSGRGGLSRDFVADFESGVDRIDLTAIGGGYSLATVGSDVLISIGEMQIQVRFATISEFAEGDIVI